MKLIVLALVFQFVISCWPKTNIERYANIRELPLHFTGPICLT